MAKFILPIFLFFLWGCADDYNPTDEGTPAPPEVVSVTPAAGATDITLTTTVVITFSEAINPVTIIPGAIELTDHNGKMIPFNNTLSEDGLTLTITPDPLDEGKTYTLALSRMLQDLNEIPLNVEETDGRYRTTFTTLKTIPAVTDTSPAAAETVSTDLTTATVTFSEKMDPLTINNGTIFISEAQGDVTFDEANNRATITLNTALILNQTYNLLVSSEIADQYGIPLDKNYQFTFNTNSNGE